MLIDPHKQGFYRTRIAAYSLLWVAFICAVPAAYALGNCSDDAPGERYWIYFDGLKGPSAAAVPADLRKQFVSTVRSEIDRLNLELQNESTGDEENRLIELVECGTNRSPSKASEFDALEMRSLNNRRVLLEMWGTLDGAAGSSNLGYVLVPPSKTATPVVYLQKKNLLTGGARGKKAVFKDNPELTAYTQIVIGLKFYNNNSYDEAGTHLCRGKILLQKFVDPLKNSSDNAVKLFVTQQLRLANEIEAIAADAVQHASPQSRLKSASIGANGFQCPVAEVN